ncbi:single-stranded right-handed parallel beta-helix fold protein, galacturonase family [Geobacter metallireducens GS-15]|uniref:Single-stranded right-handed parallel beta-helix fold protein, galacturonase family n=1 Tax=Geobacter metallireducens (strain ATCC 53774 / DSM 7210 / GS-15) TaxID=269799 RepID=Q39TM2_GEOMG|nr:right-handed parallel beta-helix repeat-containing protein [Geobacter metallireducens]ABB32402.1 single-stranded right-handed parallel beta-helix fold protein, galacturonase family [Geobacter metallireducens GS-15]
MKYRILFLMAILSIVLMAVAPKVFAATPAVLDVKLFPSFEAAVASSRTAGNVILVRTPVSCTSLTVPTDRKIYVTASGLITVNGVLDFQGNRPDAGDYRIFSGTGSVVNLSSARIKWFGARGDGKTEESALVQKAINAVAEGDMLVTRGTYIVANLQLKTGVNIIGQGEGSLLKLPPNAHVRSINGSGADDKGNYAANVIGTTLNHHGGTWFDNGARARNENNSTYIVTDVIIRDLVIDGNKARNTLGDVGQNGSAMGADISLNQAARITVENCLLINARLDGILVGYTLHGGSDYVTIRNCRIENNVRTGIAMITGKYNKILDCTIKHAGTGVGIDVEANWDGEINNHHLIKGNYVQAGIALASPQFARMNDTTVEGNTIVGGPGRNGITVSSSRVNGGTLITNNKLIGGGGGSAFVINGDAGPTEGFSPIVVSFNDASNYDYILPEQPNGSMANITMRDNRFTTKYGLQLYRPYKFEFSTNTVFFSGGTNLNPLLYILFGQASVDPNQGATILKGNTFRGRGINKLVEAVVGADAPPIKPDSLTIVGNDINVTTSAPYSMDLNYAVIIKGNKIGGFNNGIHCVGGIDGMEIIDNEIVSTVKDVPLIVNDGQFKHSKITGNKLTGINLTVTRPNYCDISNNVVVNGKGSITYTFTSGGVGSNSISGNRFTSDTDVDRPFEILVGSGYSDKDFSGEDIIKNNTYSGKYSGPAFLNSTPKSVAGNSF